MKISDLDYDGICIQSSLLTDKDWVRIKKVFIQNPLYYPNKYLNLYLYEDRLYYLDLAQDDVQKLTLKQFRNLFNNIQSKLK